MCKTVGIQIRPNILSSFIQCPTPAKVIRVGFFQSSICFLENSVDPVQLASVIHKINPDQ